MHLKMYHVSTSAACTTLGIKNARLPARARRRSTPFCAASPASSPSSAPRARTPAAPSPPGRALAAPPPEATGRRARRRPCSRAARLPRR
eukprot:scaffold13377_cov61-Phaeocystis_antarctica.AAC.5